jgi:hypothetical protein
MTDVCPDCGRPQATRMPDAISPKGPCCRAFHPVGADDCMALTLERLRAENARLSDEVERLRGERETLDSAPMLKRCEFCGELGNPEQACSGCGA